jgi:5-methylcytosine-specific restriction endonuclease McrA
MSTYIAHALRELVARRAKHRCEYCQSQEIILGMPFEVEHVVPEVVGGSSQETNLALACPRCNRYKGSLVQAVDDDTGESTPLFHPR